MTPRQQRLIMTSHVYQTFTIQVDSLFDLDDADGLSFMAKRDKSDADVNAILSMTIDNGITVTDEDTATLVITEADWPADVTSGTFWWGLMGRDEDGRKYLVEGPLVVLDTVQTDAPEAA